MLAVVAGADVAEGSYLLSSFIVAALIWVFAEWIGGAWPEARLLGIVIAGYVLGNRGFAQLSISPRLPLLPAEVTLATCGVALLIRAVFGQAKLVRRDALNLGIFAWILIATARLPMDWRTNGIMALRDFAMIYYAVFFFIGQALGQHMASAAWLRGALTIAFVALPPVAFAFQRAPEFFFRFVAIGNVPLVFHKNDLVATYLAAGFFWCWWKRMQGGTRGWLLAAAVSFTLIALIASPRAAMMGIAVGTVFWLVARRWRILGFQVSIIAVGIAVALPIVIFFGRDIKDTPLYSAYEHAISVVDFEGKRTYWNRDSGDPGGNNRFRLVWWRAVFGETVESNPTFGLGFGYDLSSRFLADYDWLTVEDFSARSPHSMIMTVFGRMGAVGLGLWLWIAVLMARNSWRAFSQQDMPALGWWSVVWVIWTSSCFGVVLEGPMGAVIFWTTLGLANAQSTEPAKDAIPAIDGADSKLNAPDESLAAIAR